MLFPSPQQQESSLESTPRRLRSLVDVYETCNMAMLKLECYEEASKKEVWVKAMEEEIKMIEKNITWELIDCPHGKDIIRVKWVYKTKLNPDGTIQKHKVSHKALSAKAMKIHAEAKPNSLCSGQRILRYLHGIKEFGIWYKIMTNSRILEEMSEQQEGLIEIYYNNKSAIAKTKNPIHHQRTKHIAIKYHFIKEAKATKEI
ncbi:putative mitochondrial protein, partial [Mucuna pruriens]